MFRKAISKQQNSRQTAYDSSSSHSAGCSEYPDTVNLPPTLGEIESLPASYQVPVSNAFISQLRDQPRIAQRSNLQWLNMRLESSVQIASFTSFLGTCKTNEIVWVYSRYHDMLFQMLYDAFVLQIEYLNMMPERFVSPASRPIVDLLTPIEILYQMVLLLPRLIATGWRQEDIANILIVLLDHGNNQDVRTLGQHLLTPYMLALGDKVSPRVLDLFNNMLVLRAFEFVDMPAASMVVGDLFCAIGGGVGVTDLGYGQRAIIAFESGRPSICPVMQDRVCAASPQGILALSMMRHMLETIAYTAFMVSSPRAAYTEYESYMLQARTQVYPFKILSLEFSLPQIFNMPNGTGNCLHLVTPVLAYSGTEVRNSATTFYRCFRDKYMNWIYPDDCEDALKVDGLKRPVRRIPVLGLRIFVDYMLRCMLPIFDYMLPEGEFLMPSLRTQQEKMPDTLASSVSATSDASRPSTSRSGGASGNPETAKYGHHIDYHFSATPESYAFLRGLMLDDDVESTNFFIDVLCLAMRYPSENSNTTQQTDALANDPGSAKVGYEVALGALTVVRLWLLAHEEHQPRHLRITGRDKHELCSVIEMYVGCAHNIVKALVEQGDWSEEKLVLMYNALLVHRAVIRTYVTKLPPDYSYSLLTRLQGIVESFLERMPDNPDDVHDENSAASQALTLLTECLVPSWIAIDIKTDKLMSLAKRFYSIKTPWTLHMDVWGNVLRAITISRGRELYGIDERTLIHEFMFAGSRQRRGRRMVDAYMEQLHDISFHQHPSKFILEGAFDTSTPFNITSNLAWSAMRRIMSHLQKSARAAALNRDKCKMIDPQASGSNDGSVQHDSVDLLKTGQDILTRVCYSGARNLCEEGSAMAEKLLPRIVSGLESGVLSRSSYAWLVESVNTLRNYSRTEPCHSANRSFDYRSGEPLSASLSASTNEPPPAHSLRRIVASLTKKKHPLPPIARTANASPTSSTSKPCLFHKNMSSANLIENRTMRTHSHSVSEVSGHSQGEDTFSDNEAAKQACPGSEGSGVQTAIRPAKLEPSAGNHQSSSQLAFARMKGAMHTFDIDSQKEEVVASNHRVAWNMMGDMLKIVWLLESLWVDVDLGAYIKCHHSPSEVLEHLWIAWVDLLGPLDPSQVARTRAILRGLTKCWKAVRITLNNIYTYPDNDQVMLNIPQWVNQGVYIFSDFGEDGRNALTSILRLGCLASDTSLGTGLEVRSYFIQLLLIYLCPIARGEPFDHQFVEAIVQECRNIMCTGMPGSKMLLYVIEQAMHRLLFERETYEETLSDRAIECANLLMISIATLLSSERTLFANYRDAGVAKLTDAHDGGIGGSQDPLISAIRSLRQQTFPAVVRPNGSSRHVLTWERGGPIFGRLCESLWKIAADDSHLAALDKKPQLKIEHNVMRGLAVICASELSIADTSLQHSQLITNCLVSNLSRLFSDDLSTVHTTTNNIAFLVVNHPDPLKYLGYPRLQMIAMELMKAIIEQLDRLEDHISTDKVKVIWDMVWLLEGLLSAAPALITLKGVAKDDIEDPAAVRDFLVEKIHQRFAHPNTPGRTIPHLYNQILVRYELATGTVLRLEPALYTPPAKPKRQTMANADSPTQDCENAAAMLMHIGEIFYAHMMFYFDESVRQQNILKTELSTDDKSTIVRHFDEGLDECIVYAHGNMLMSVFDEKDTEFCIRSVRCCANKQAWRVYIPHDMTCYPERRSHEFDSIVCRNQQASRTTNMSASDATGSQRRRSEPKIVVHTLTSKDIFNYADIPESMRDATFTIPSAYQQWGRDRKGSDPEDHRMFEEIQEFLKEERDAVLMAEGNNNAAHPISPAVENVIRRYTVSPTDARKEQEGISKLGRYQELVRYHKAFNMGQSISCVHSTLKMSDALIRDLRALDKIHSRETIKAAVFFVGHGQRDESQILSNTVADTSERYRQFIRSLGWYVDLATFDGFTAKMESDGSDGKVCLYFANEHIEFVFHEASLMPFDPKDPRQTNKKRHIGNDHVHIIWNESKRRYRPETISGDFGNVQIRIRPLSDGLYGVGIYHDSHIDDVGPLTGGMVVSADVLPYAVRATAIKGYRIAKEAFFGSFAHPYIVRQNRINEIIEKHRNDSELW